MTAYDDARARLPTDVVALCDKAITEFKAYWALRAAGQAKGSEYPKSRAAYIAMEKALEQVELGSQDDQLRPMSSLTSEQRDVITLLSEDDIPIDSLVPLAGCARRRRRTLGIDPPSLLEELVDGKPRWEIYKQAAELNEQEPDTGLPDEQRIEALVEGVLGGYPGKYQTQLERILDTHSKYAGAFAARTLTSLGQEGWYQLYSLGATLFTVLARSKTPIPQEADWLFPITAHMYPPIPIPRVVEHALALPLGRRERVLIDAMWRSEGAYSSVLAAIVAVLVTQPMEAVLDEALRYAVTKKKETKDSKASLIALEKQLLAMKKGAALKVPKRIVLKLESVLRPKTIDELDAIRQEQLRIAGDRWEGVARPAARRLATDESDDSSFGGNCEWRVFSHGKRRIDAWLYGVDSGTYFTAGTVERIGEMIQRSVRMENEDDASLEQALEAAAGAKDAAATKAVPKRGKRNEVAAGATRRSGTTEKKATAKAKKRGKS